MALLKMIILSFKSFELKDLNRPFIFNVMFNPASYKIETNLNKDQAQTGGGAVQTSPLNAIELKKMSFDFLIDGTGASGDKRNVLLEVKKFEGVVMPSKSELNALAQGTKPELPKLILIWGSFVFTCEIDSYAVNYTLFNSLGIPLRATISATFLEVQKGSPTDILDRFMPEAINDTVTGIASFLSTSFALTGNVAASLEKAKEENLNTLRQKVTI